MTVDVIRDGGVLVATLNRPEKKNALTGAMYRALREALLAASADAAIGAVLVTGAGGAFCAGNDIGDFLAESRAQSEGARTGAGGLGAELDAKDLLGLDGIAVGFGQGLLAHHHRRVGLGAQVSNHACGNRGHLQTPSSAPASFVADSEQNASRL